MSWLAGWDYRKSITLSRASGAVTNYQMKLLVGESSGATGENVDCGGKCLSTFNDLRFTTSDGTTLLDYWIESISGTTPNRLATVWIEFDSIGTGDTTFYMYYGNASASAASNGANTFPFFDDFERGADGDDVGGDWVISNGSMKISTTHDIGDAGGFGTRSLKLVGANGARPYGHAPFTFIDGAHAVRARYFKPDATSSVQLSAQVSNSKYASANIDSNENINWLGAGGVWTDSTHNANADSWASILELRELNASAGTYKVYYNDVLCATATSMFDKSLAPCVYVAGMSSTGHDSWIDNILVRQYLPTEPAWGSWGSEEIEPTPGPRYWVGNTGYWNDRAHWSLTSGGTGGAPVPTADNDVHFDSNSFTEEGQHIEFS